MATDCGDNDFGPVVISGPNCRDFDFTLFFEDLFFTLIPAALMLLVAAIQIVKLWKKPVLLNWKLFRAMKLFVYMLYISLQAALLALWVSAEMADTKTSCTTASAVFALLVAFQMCILSYFSHDRSVKPSDVLCSYLLITIILDVARTRTYWLLRLTYIASLSTASISIKVVILVLEFVKEFDQTADITSSQSPEESSGIFNRSLFLWLDPLIFKGSKKSLTLDDLFPVDSALSSRHIFLQLQSSWKSGNKSGKHSLAWAAVKSFKYPLILTIFPRLCLVGFNIAQPFLVGRAISYVSSSSQEPNNIGYGLIGAYGLTYLGIAFSTVWFQHLTSRLMTSLRGGLISLVFNNMLDLKANDDAAALSLMGTDVDRITGTLIWVQNIWADIIQIALALWILESHIGGACIAPVIVALACGVASAKVGNLIGPRQRSWMQAIQERVGVTTEVLDSMKGVKMLGLSDKVFAVVQGLRDSELEASKSFRRVQITNIVLGNIPAMVSPVITFASFAIAAKLAMHRELDVSQAFLSLSLLSILIFPTSELVSATTNLTAALDCFNRIQEYLLREKRIDYRSKIQTKSLEMGTTESSSSKKVSKRVPERISQAVSIKDGKFGLPERVILPLVNIQFEQSTLTMVIGPVGSGKSTLLKAILGEAIRFDGFVDLFIAEKSIAYCDSAPWIPNLTVQKILLGPSDFSEDWYKQVIYACCLQEDIQGMPDGDQTIVGSKGIILSGGQKQRLALARAVYSKNELILLDNVLSGLDAATEVNCFHRLLGENGILRRSKSTIIFATHSVRWLPYSDHIIVLQEDGRVAQDGTFAELNLSEGYVKDLNITYSEDLEITKASSLDGEDHDVMKNSPDNPKEPPAIEGSKDISKKRGRSDSAVLSFYIKSMGYFSFILFVVLVASQAAFAGLQTLWLNWWVEYNQNNKGARLGYWFGIYGLFSGMVIVSLGLSCSFLLILVIPRSARKLHWIALEAVMSAPMTFFFTTDTGTIVNRFSQDLTLVDLALPIALVLTSEKFALTIAESILTCIASGYLAIALPFLGISLFFLQKIYLRTSRQMRLLDLESKSPLYSHFIESANGLVTLRAFSWTEEANSKGLAYLDLSQRPYYLLYCLQRWLSLVLDLIVAALAIVLVTLAVTLRHQIKPGLLGVAMISVMNLGQTMSYFITSWTSLETSLGAVSRLRQFSKETPSEIEDFETHVPHLKWPETGHVSFQNVSASYSTVESAVLSEINIDVQSGSKLAVCGRTGCGKSSLISLLFRMLDPIEGSITISGVDIHNVSKQRVRKAIVALPQEPFFLAGSMRLNLDPHLEYSDEEIKHALIKTELMATVDEQGGLDAAMDSNAFSSGQRQLFCLTRALLSKGKILVLDEATSSVDQKTERLIHEVIMHEFKNWTIISVIHHLQFVTDFDQVAVLDRGRLIELGSPTELLQQRSFLADIFHT